jgi:hypothetical protein
LALMCCASGGSCKMNSKISLISCFCTRNYSTGPKIVLTLILKIIFWVVRHCDWIWSGQKTIPKKKVRTSKSVSLVCQNLPKFGSRLSMLCKNVVVSSLKGALGE